MIVPMTSLFEHLFDHSLASNDTPGNLIHLEMAFVSILVMPRGCLLKMEDARG